MMKRIAKIIALVFDVVLMPIRFLFGLEIIITGAIMNDMSIKETLDGYMEILLAYPNLVKECTKNILSED